MVTIKTLAQKANTSPSTVSRVLNAKEGDKISASEETIKRIRELAEQENYIPNQMARAMKTKYSRCIGVIVPDVNDPYFIELYHEIKEQLWKRKYNSILFSIDSEDINDSINQQRDLLLKLNYWHLDGVIFTFSDMHGQIQNVCQMYKEAKPIVTISNDTRDVGEVPYSRIVVDLVKGTERGIKYLLGQGINDILYFGHKYDLVDARRVTFERVLKERGIEFNENMIIDSRYLMEHGYNSAATLISENRIPQAIFCVNDNVAIGAMNCFSNKGYKIPQDISIIGVNDITLTKYTNPPLTTVHQPLQKMASSAVEIIIKKIEEETKENVSILFDTELVIRESVI